MKLIKALEAKSTNDRRRKRIEAWIDTILAAENVARAEAESDPNLKPRHLLINSRIASDVSKTMGTAGERRDALVEIIGSLKPLERHLSTSTWLVRLYIQEATEIKDLLIGPLDEKLDTLHVAHASWINRAAFGTSELRS